MTYLCSDLQNTDYHSLRIRPAVDKLKIKAFIYLKAVRKELDILLEKHSKTESSLDYYYEKQKEINCLKRNYIDNTDLIEIEIDTLKQKLKQKFCELNKISLDEIFLEKSIRLMDEIFSIKFKIKEKKSLIRSDIIFVQTILNISDFLKTKIIETEKLHRIELLQISLLDHEEALSLSYLFYSDF